MSTASDEPPAPPRLPRAVSQATAPPRAWPAVSSQLLRASGCGAAPGGVPFERIALSPFAKRLVGATASQLCIVNVALGAVLETVPTAHGGVTALCYSSDGLRALSGGEDGRLRVWRVEDDAAKAGTL